MFVPLRNLLFGIFVFHLFIYPLICKSMFVSHIAHILSIRIHICKRYYYRFYYSWYGTQKNNKSYVLDYICRLILSMYLILYYYSIDLFNYFSYICYLLVLFFRRRQSENFLLLKCFYSKELDQISFQANVPLKHFIWNKQISWLGFCIIV